MPQPSVNVAAPITPPALVEGIEKLKAECAIPGDFPREVLADAENAATRAQSGTDLTRIPFVTIDPATSMDLDQALFIERAGDGYTVYYAIDDVAAWVTPDGPMDVESHRRGQTCYLPDERIGLYPPVISEGAASLLAEDPPRPAIVWTLQLDAAGALTNATCARALIRNRRKMSYPEVQQLIDSGQADNSLQLLKVVGELRIQQEIARGGISLPLPEQQIDSDGHGGWSLSYAAALPVENWNAQISLLTGIAAAELMISAKVGVVRTLPPADERALARLRHTAQVLRIPWAPEQSYPDFVRSLDPAEPAHLAMLNACTTLFRGAGYVAFHGELPDVDLQHSALACRYAHTTAPLRRLIDRYVLEICVCLCAGEPVPAWVLDKLDALPQEMSDSDHRVKKFERGIVDLVEALVLADEIGQQYPAVVVDNDPAKHTSRVVIRTHAIEGNLTGDAAVGSEVTVTLTSADVATGKVAFALA